MVGGTDDAWWHLIVGQVAFEGRITYLFDPCLPYSKNKKDDKQYNINVVRLCKGCRCFEVVPRSPVPHPGGLFKRKMIWHFAKMSVTLVPSHSTTSSLWIGERWLSVFRFGSDDPAALVCFSSMPMPCLALTLTHISRRTIQCSSHVLGHVKF